MRRELALVGILVAAASGVEAKDMMQWKKKESNGVTTGFYQGCMVMFQDSVEKKDANLYVRYVLFQDLKSLCKAPKDQVTLPIMLSKEDDGYHEKFTVPSMDLVDDDIQQILREGAQRMANFVDQPWYIHLVHGHTFRVLKTLEARPKH